MQQNHILETKNGAILTLDEFGNLLLFASFNDFADDVCEKTFKIIMTTEELDRLSEKVSQLSSVTS